MKDMADWSSLLAGQVSDPGPLIAEAAGVLDAFLQARPQADSEVLAVIGRRLGTGVGVKTLGEVHTALSSYLGQDPAYLVAWVTRTDQVNRIAQVEATASPRVAAFLRAILGMYGAELAQAYTRWNELPDDWSLITREIRYDLLNERLLVKVLIDKYNGEQVVIEGPANSILELTVNMLRTCNMVGRTDAFAQRTADMLAKEYEEFRTLVGRPSDEAARPSQG
ncbi:MAG: hypothetical protein QN168_03545 [Armatimonadota bacterium]|nr:hypothetical protein [Armatimonadota bacterium]